jgi:nicotinate-nucleotide adenylyltransferase
MSPKKIGILGGTFDPPHIAHLIIAQEALEKLKLDQIWFVPGFIPPHKWNNPVTKARQRWQMLKLALSGNRKFVASDIELRRKGISYTVDTLRRLSLQKPKRKLYLILGADNLKFLSGWKEPEEIFRLAQVVFVPRPGLELSRANSWVKKGVLLEAPLLEISSSQIRERVKKGKSVAYRVPEKVRKYIGKYKLYQR